MSDKLDRFTKRARRVLTLAQEEAQRLNHSYLGTEHLLLGLIREEDGVAFRILCDLVPDPKQIRERVERTVGRGQGAMYGKLSLTPRSKRVIELAVDEARRLGHHYIGTEHLLLGLVRAGEGVAVDVLRGLGVSLDKVRSQTARIMMESSAQVALPVQQPSINYPQANLQTPVSPKKPIRILFLAANPSDTTRLKLDEEIRGIDQALRQSEFRDKFDIRHHWAVRIIDIQSLLLRHKPDIVHFSGHGTQKSEIIFQNNSGDSHPVTPRALSRLFSVLKDNIRCVVLNACYSEKQADSIAEHIDCVIGMSTSIGDDAAISFATAFYQALGYGRDIKTAFDLGCIQVDLESFGEQDTPILISTKNDPKGIAFVKNS